MRVQEYFDATLLEWEAIYRRGTLYSTIYRERLHAALGCVDRLRTRGAALDVGCGPGFGSVGLCRRGFRVHAIDSSAGMVERTLARARAESLSVEGSVCDLRALPLPDGAFELAFVVGVSEWLESLEQPLAELARVLAPGGALVLTADNRWALSALIDPLQNPLVVPLKRALGRGLRRISPARRPLRTWPRSRRELERALAHAGFSVTEATTLGFGPFTFLNRALVSDAFGHALHRRLGGVPWLRGAGLCHVLVARKWDHREPARQ